MSTDPDSKVRLAVLKVLENKFDCFMKLVDNIEKFLFPLLTNDNLEVKRISMSLLSRLSENQYYIN